MPVEVDPPIQRVCKRLITPFFTPRAVAAYGQPTRDLVNGLIDKFIETGRPPTATMPSSPPRTPTSTSTPPPPARR